jgi:hypothetical protein
MTLRESLGVDSERIHKLVDAVLDSEDGVLILFDGSRVVTYAHGFGVSASQLELLGVELERALRSVVGRQPTNRTSRRRNHERNQRHRRGARVDGDGDRSVDGVLRLAGKVA